MLNQTASIKIWQVLTSDFWSQASAVCDLAPFSQFTILCSPFTSETIYYVSSKQLAVSGNQFHAP